jgi:hypothetical protein
MHQIFRPRKYYRNVGVLCLVFFLGMMICSVVAFVLQGPPNQNIYTAFFICGLWGFMSCLMVWLLLVYKRESLHILEEKIIQQGVIRSKTVELREITVLHWKCAPSGGSVILCSPSNTIKISLGNFEPEQRQSLIRFFRLITPGEIQRDWKPFCHKIAVPMRVESLDLPLKPDEVLLTRRRWNKFFLICFLVLTILCVAIKWLLQNPRALLVPVGLVPVWLLMRFVTPRKGMRSKTLSSEGKEFLPFLIWFAVAIGGTYLFSALQNQIPWFAFWATFAFVAWFGVLLLIAYHLDRRKRRADLAQAEGAAAEWERLEAESLWGDQPQSGS